jgi:hypothetical protein
VTYFGEPAKNTDPFRDPFWGRIVWSSGLDIVLFLVVRANRVEVGLWRTLLMTIVGNPSSESGPPREATDRQILMSSKLIQEVIEKSRPAHSIQNFCRYLWVRLAGVFYVCPKVLVICDLVKRSCKHVRRVGMGFRHLCYLSAGVSAMTGMERVLPSPQYFPRYPGQNSSARVNPPSVGLPLSERVGSKTLKLPPSTGVHLRFSDGRPVRASSSVPKPPKHCP